MNYIDVYFSRANHMGENVQEIARNTGERSFERWLQESPHTVKNLSVDRGLYFPAIILTQKDLENKKIMLLNVSVTVPIRIGDMLNWEDEKWLIYSKERKVNETYQTFEMVRCNYLLSWVDDDGILHSSWAYFKSSLDAQIKEHFVKMYSALFDSTNKYAELIMPQQNIKRQTRFIINEEAWRVSEFDKTTVPEIIYISLTEDTINDQYDDVEKGIADVPKKAKYEIISSENIQNFTVGSEITPMFYIMKDGKIVDEEYEIISQDKSIVKVVDGKLKAIKKGAATLIIQLKNNSEVKMEFEIKVSDSEEFNAFIEGDDKLKLNRTAAYQVKSNDNSKIFTFSLDSDEFAKIDDVDGNLCMVRANNKNKIGITMLNATCGNVILTKEIKISPLW